MAILLTIGQYSARFLMYDLLLWTVTTFILEGLCTKFRKTIKGLPAGRLIALLYTIIAFPVIVVDALAVRAKPYLRARRRGWYVTYSLITIWVMSLLVLIVPLGHDLDLGLMMLWQLLYFFNTSIVSDDWRRDNGGDDDDNAPDAPDEPPSTSESVDRYVRMLSHMYMPKK